MVEHEECGSGELIREEVQFVVAILSCIICRSRADESSVGSQFQAVDVKVIVLLCLQTKLLFSWSHIL